MSRDVVVVAVVVFVVVVGRGPPALGRHGIVVFVVYICVFETEST